MYVALPCALSRTHTHTCEHAQTEEEATTVAAVEVKKNQKLTVEVDGRRKEEGAVAAVLIHVIFLAMGQ